MKKLIAIFILLGVALASSLPLWGAEGTVSYQGRAKGFIFEPGSEHSPTDLFPDFKDVMPGDTLTQKITIKNDADKNVKVKIYLRSLGARQDSVEFLSQLGLTVRTREGDEQAYLFDAAASQRAQLGDWVCLGTLYSGGNVSLDVTLDVPVTLDDEFQSRIGTLDWEFKVEEFPVEDTDPKPPPTDGTNAPAWIFLMLLPLTGALLLLWHKRRTEEAGSAN